MIGPLKDGLLTLPVRYLTRHPRVYLVCGMPRSGNHALVNWLANAMEGQPTSYRKVDNHPYLYRFGSGKTLFLNNVRIRAARHYIQTLRMNRKLISNARYLIVSLEGTAPEYRDWHVPSWDYRIYVKRSLLNMVASRLRGLKRKAEQGLADPHLVVDEKLFRLLKSWKKTEGHHTWMYDRWLTSGDYRANFLRDINLGKDIMPEMGSVGASSFNPRKTPESHEALNRYRQVEFPDRVVELLFRHQQLLTAEEEEWLRNRYGGKETG